MLGRAPSLEERAPSLEGSAKMETTFLDLMRSEIAPHIMKFAWRYHFCDGQAWHIGVLETLSTEFRRWDLADETIVQHRWVIDHLEDHLAAQPSEYPDSLASEEVSL